MCLKKIAVSERKSSLVCWIVGSHGQCGRITGIVSLQNLHYQRHLSAHSLADLLGCCARSQDIRGGAMVHAESIKHGFDSDTSFANIVINFYAKCGSLAQALIAFRSMPDKDTVSWNCLISGYAKQGRGEAAFESFRQMKRMRFDPDNYTFGSLLGFCSANAATEETRELHCHIFKSGFQRHEAVACSLIDAYGKCSRPEDARHVFDNMPRRNVVVWTALIAGYASSGRAHEAMDLFVKMVETSDSHEINEYIFTSVLNAFCDDEALQHGKQVQVQAIKRGLEQEVSVANALVTMYARCGSIDDALKAFQLSSNHDMVSWNAMLAGFVQNSHATQVFSLFRRMQDSGLRSNSFTFVSLLKACAMQEALQFGRQIHACCLKMGVHGQTFVATAVVGMYAKCGSFAELKQGFLEISDKDIVSWTSMIAGCLQKGNAEEALNLFCQMKHGGIVENQFTTACVLRACADLAGLEQGQQLHANSCKIGLDSTVIVGCALTNMYSKCGSIEDALAVFNSMPTRDVVTWNSIIAGAAHHGQAQEAFRLFQQMQQSGVNPDEITFINILSACSHCGLLEQGWAYFQAMKSDYDIIPAVDHYSCMVDILARAGQLEQAEEFIKNASIEHKVLLWRALLSACKIHENVDIAERAGAHLLEQEPDEPGTYVLLSRIYEAAGRLNDAAKIRKLMNDRGLKKIPGRSWIRVKGRVHVFSVADRCHPQSDEIHELIERLLKDMKVSGYVPNTKSSLHD